MKLMSEALEHGRLRAPAENGGTLIVPPLATLGEVIEQNAARAAAYEYDLQGRSLRQVADQARA